MKYLSSFLYLFIYSFSFAQYRTESNITYTAHQETYSKERCKLDFYYSIEKKDFVTGVSYQGGAHTGEDKEIPQYLKTKNIAIVGATYRLSPQAKVEDIIQDAADAVKWTFDNVERVGGNKNKVVIAGLSAG